MHDRPSLFSDLVVLELASILAGPSVGMFFAELGARVIKIENASAGGDTTRQWKLATEDPCEDRSAYFSSVNWGKESVALDLKKPGGREAVRDLIRRADVLILSYKPGDEKKLGLSHDDVKPLNPKLIYAQITAYGPGDPRPGFDAIIQAESGFTFMNGDPAGGPTKMPVALIDLLLAHQLKEGILLALMKRQRTGEGSYLCSSLIQSAVASLANQATNWLAAGVIPQRIGSEHPNIVPYGTVLDLADGRQIVVAAGTDAQFREFAGAIELPELNGDARFATNQGRVRHRDELTARIAAAVARSPAEPLIERLRARKIPFGFVNDMRQVFEQPAAAGMILEAAGEDGAPARGVRSIAFEGDAAALDPALAPPPRLGQHTDAVLAGFLGYSPERIRELRQSGSAA